MGSSDSVSKEIISSIKSIFDFYFQLKLTLVCLGVNHNSRKNWHKQSDNLKINQNITISVQENLHLKERKEEIM